MTAAVALPRLMRVGAGALGELPEMLEELGLSRPLVVTDAFQVETGRVATVLKGLAGRGMMARVFADTIPDPTAASVLAGIAFLEAGDHDCVVAIGGGSPIDTAKAIAVMGPHGGAPSRYKAPHVQSAPGLPIVAVPTTAGTGSEATRFTIITDEATDEKMLCAGTAYLPVAAVVDYELTLSKPARLTADTGIDSLTHAIEAYVSRRANPFSDQMALAAMRLIAPNLRRVFHHPDDADAREAMMLGATLAGMAFSNASVALVHGMSRPIGAHFHIAHGLSNAMLLPAVTAWSLPAALPRYARCAREMGLTGGVEGVVDDAADADLLVEELRALNRDLAVPDPAAADIEAGRWRELIPLMTGQALTSGSPANNPRVPDAAQIADLYRQVYTTG